ncbi:MAG: class A beta-lactamase-related serine hydrolase [Sphingobacteriales bacterium]|nr:MAG: class A beta-lactamase-related serine hydrolase [Sphingobacteriales bacterium]
MRKVFFPYFVSFIMAALFMGCHSETESASANPKSPYPDEPVKRPIAISYEDTTSPQYRELIRQLDEFYNRQVRAGFNGSVLIGHKGKVLYERYFGWANRENGQKWMPTSASQLASVSKTFTGGAILYLHEHKYLDINERVNTYIPTFPYPELTVKMLLNHRSGLPDYLKWVPVYRKDQKTPINNTTLMHLFATYRPKLEFKPNTHFKYSNSNYAVLASVIEAVTEMRYHDFMKKYVFEPIGMKNTFMYDAAVGLPVGSAVSYKYNWVREPDMFADGVAGDKGIYSTPQDMYRWDQSFYKNILLSNETIELAYGPCSFEKPGIKNYGLGWRMLCYPDGDKVIYHNGWWHGNNTVFYRYIKDNYTVIVLGNKYNSSIYRQEKAISAITNLASSNSVEMEGAD